MPRNDEELAGPEGRGGKASAGMLPDKPVPRSYHLPFLVFLCFLGERHLLSLLPRRSSLILLSSSCQRFCVRQKQKTAARRRTKQKTDNGKETGERRAFPSSDWKTLWLREENL